MIPSLDDAAVYKQVDPTGLGERIASMPTQCRDAWVKAQAFSLPDAYRKAQRVLLLGMGGSAIGGDLLADLQEQAGAAPVEVHRGYGRAAPPDRDTLVIASSNSGNTEETFSAFQKAWKPGTLGLICTRGGILATHGEMLGVPVFPMEVGGEPRCAVGYSLFALLGFMQRLGLAQDRSGEVVEAIGLMQRMVRDIGPDVPTRRNLAKEMAVRAHGKALVIVGAQHLTATAKRWKTQIAENAKGLAFWDTLPEGNHNTIEGLQYPPGAPNDFFWVMLESSLYSPRVAMRFAYTKQILADSGYAFETHGPQGKGALAQVMTTVLFGDYVSYYLAIANGVDPSATPNLNRFKKLMAGQ